MHLSPTRWFLAGVVLALCPVFSVALAATLGGDPAVVFSWKSAGSGTETMRGWTFSTNSAVKITALGVFDHWNPNGLEGSHQVAIWDSSDAIVASATVPAGTGAEKIGKDRYVGVTPLILPAGETFLIAAQYVGAEARQDWFAHAYHQLDFDPAISFIEGRSLNTTDFVQPTSTWTTPMIGPNLLIQPVPLPAALALFAGALGLLFRRRRLDARGGAGTGT